MTQQLWTIAKISDGTVLAASIVTDGPGVHPKDRGWPWDATTQKATQISKVPDTVNQTWSGTAWIDAPAKVEATLLGMVDDTREAKQMLYMTAGGAKKYEYAAKALEATDSLTLTAVLLNALALTDKKKRFPFAYTESQLTGETLGVVLARYVTGKTASAAENARNAAICQKGKIAIKAATTAAAKRAAYAAINWDWKPPA